MHPYDRYFYDPALGNYTVDRYLQDLEDRYGGIDALLLWPTYSNIGVDDRNQFDYFRVMPGGLEALKDVTDQLHQRGVKVLLPYNPWDGSTRREPDDDATTFAKILKQTNGDGINGDTLGYVDKSFWDRAMDLEHPIALEPEWGNNGAEFALLWSTMGWGYWPYPYIPVVDFLKYITGSKYMTNVCDRWAFSKTDNLQMAFFNGDGYESWENVWGVWNGITPRDSEALRRVATMLRFFGASGHLRSPEWEPHAQNVYQDGLFASKWPLPEQGSTLWTVVNRGDANFTDAKLLITEAGKTYYDCYRGLQLKAPPSPGPAPPDPKGFNIFRESAVVPGTSGTALDANPLTDLSNLDCAARCSSKEECACVTWSPDRTCQRFAGCQPALFEQADSVVYLKPVGYSAYEGLNCYSGHGGDDIDRDAVPDLSAEQCMARCDGHAECQCVTFAAAGGLCWMRTNCQSSGFVPGDLTVYVNEARRVPAPAPPAPPGSTISFQMEAHGFGCVIETAEPATGALADFLAKMRKITKHPLAFYSGEWKYLPQTLVEIPKTTPVKETPEGMVLVPSGAFYFSTSSVQIEGDDGHGVDVQYPWEEHPQRGHDHDMQMEPFFIDKYPVTCGQYAAYLQATGYSPKDPYNWLKDWGGSRTPSADLVDRPVTYVGLEEARAFCAWRGARLPHSYEWQYAAQGTDGRPHHNFLSLGPFLDFPNHPLKLGAK